MRPSHVRKVLESFEQIAFLWQKERLHLFRLSDEGELIELIGWARSTARLANWIGVRTDTSTFREMASRILLKINPLINQQYPTAQRWEMESVEELSAGDLDRYHQLIELPLKILSLPDRTYPAVPLPIQMHIVICELLLGMQRHVESLREPSH